MGSTGIQVIGTGAVIERGTAHSNAGGGFLVAGSVIESVATSNGTFGIFAITVRDCIATDNHDNGIVLDGSGGTAYGDIASFNGGFGIQSPKDGTNSTTVRNTSFGISAACPSTIVNNTVVSNGAGTISTSGVGCVLVNNATR
jgi:hypothetical protein